MKAHSSSLSQSQLFMSGGHARTSFPPCLIGTLSGNVQVDKCNWCQARKHFSLCCAAEGSWGPGSVEHGGPGAVAASQDGVSQPAVFWQVGTAPGVSRAGVPHQGRSVLKVLFLNAKLVVKQHHPMDPGGSDHLANSSQGHSALRCCWTLMTVVETWTTGKACWTDTALSFGRWG